MEQGQKQGSIQSGRLSRYTVLAIYQFTQSYKEGDLENQKLYLDIVTEGLSLFFTFANPRISYGVDRINIERVKSRQIDVTIKYQVENCNYQALRLYEKLFRLIAEHRRDVCRFKPGEEQTNFTFTLEVSPELT